MKEVEVSQIYAQSLEGWRIGREVGGKGCMRDRLGGLVDAWIDGWMDGWWNGAIDTWMTE